MNKPVAWMAKKNCQNGLDDFSEHSEDYPDWQIEEFKESYIPLYTHQLKELSDEEITEVVSLFLKVQFQLNNPSSVFDYKGFAKAILRKASEK